MPIGTNVGAYFGGGDGGLTQMTSSFWGSAYPAWINWPGDTGAGVFGVDAPMKGNYVCHTGVKTRTGCGIIDDPAAQDDFVLAEYSTDPNTHAQYQIQPAASFYDMIKVVNDSGDPQMCAMRGDSGVGRSTRTPDGRRRPWASSSSTCSAT